MWAEWELATARSIPSRAWRGTDPRAQPTAVSLDGDERSHGEHGQISMGLRGDRSHERQSFLALPLSGRARTGPRRYRPKRRARCW